MSETNLPRVARNGLVQGLILSVGSFLLTVFTCLIYDVPSTPVFVAANLFLLAVYLPGLLKREVLSLAMVELAAAIGVFLVAAALMTLP